MTAVTYRSTEWMTEARCIEIPGFTELELHEQRPLCNSCPVREQCTAYGAEDPAATTWHCTTYAGMTHRALRKIVSQVERQPVPVPLREGAHEITCTRCGAVAGANSRRARYCSDYCRHAAFDEKRSG